jgi:hypothetical protein
MRVPSKHRVGRVLFNATFIMFLTGVVAMFVVAGTMWGYGAWAETIAAVIAIPIIGRICSDMADYAISLMLE